MENPGLGVKRKKGGSQGILVNYAAGSPYKEPEKTRFFAFFDFLKKNLLYKKPEIFFFFSKKFSHLNRTFLNFKKIKFL